VESDDRKEDRSILTRKKERRPGNSGEDPRSLTQGNGTKKNVFKGGLRGGTQKKELY